MRSLLLLLALLAIGCAPSYPNDDLLAPKHVKPLAHVSIPQHPRLLATPEDFNRIATTADPILLRWREQIVANAKKCVTEPPVTYGKEKGIEIARDVLRRVTHLALAYRLTHEQRFLDRAREDILAACHFADWDHPSFLATAEMTTAVAVGYDWLYGDLSDSERATIRQAIINKGLHAGVLAYQHHASWVDAKHNWNLVCNGGLIVGALAVVDEDNTVAQAVIDSAIASLAHGEAGFAPDGGWEEGPTYWNYGTRYLCFAMVALKNTYNSMYGIESAPGIARTGDFRINEIGPIDKNFNFADSTEEPGDSPQMFAFASLFKKPVYAAFEAYRSHSDPTVFDLLWYRPSDPATLAALPKDALFRGIGLATFRSAWQDSSATFVGFKGGSNKAHHGHLDAGTFVLDALGQRWAVDLGSDDYGAPGYFDAERWTYYRASTPGHNCLTFEGRNEDDNAAAPMIAFASTNSRAHAAIDLTHAYGISVKAERILRGVALLNRRDVLVQDEINLERPEHVTWAMHTRAKVTVDGRTATLTQNGQTLTAHLLYPPDVTFEAAPAPNLPKQEANAGVTKLMIHFLVQEPTHIAVLFTPGSAAPQIPKLTPVSDWQDDEGLAEPSHSRHVDSKKMPPPEFEPAPMQMRPPSVHRH